MPERTKKNAGGTGRISDRKAALKRALAENLGRLLKRRGMKVSKLAVLLQERGADINTFAVRAWLRHSEKRPTLPSCQNLVCLCEALGVTCEELLGLSTGNAISVFTQLRKGEDRFEQDLLRIMASLSATYEAGSTGTQYEQAPFATVIDPAAPVSMEGDADTDRRASCFLIANDLVRINPPAINRDTPLETSLASFWESTGNGSHLDHACVYRLPNRVAGQRRIFNGIAEIVFLRCAAQYLIDNVICSGSTIGLAGGRTVATLMKLLPRSDKLQGCTFFPLLRPSMQFTDAAVGSAAVISDALFRYGDLGVRMPDEIDRKDTIETWVNVADVLLFSLGGVERSSIMRLLQSIRSTAAPEDRQKLRTALAGDVLFHVFTRSGRTLEDAVVRGSGAPEAERQLAEELLGPQAPHAPLASTGGHNKFDRTRLAYARHVADVRLDLACLQNHAAKPNRRTIVVVAGTDKLDILRIFLAKVCRNGMHITLITEQSLARELITGAAAG